MNDNKRSEYYRQLGKLLNRFRTEIKFHIKMGGLYKAVYEAADKYGNEHIKDWAAKKNEEHYQLGTILNEQALNLCTTAIDYLYEFMKEDT